MIAALLVAWVAVITLSYKGVVYALEKTHQL